MLFVPAFRPCRILFLVVSMMRFDANIRRVSIMQFHHANIDIRDCGRHQVAIITYRTSGSQKYLSLSFDLSHNLK